MYFAVFLCVQPSAGTPALLLKSSDVSLEVIGKESKEENYIEGQEDKVPHDWYKKNSSEVTLPLFNAGAVVIGDGENTAPRLIEKTPLSLTDLPIGYVQERKIELSFLIGEKGEIVDLKVLPFRGKLPATMIESIKQWKFSPYIQNGKPAACVYVHQERILPFRVTLRDGESANVPPMIKNPQEQCFFAFGNLEIKGSMNSKVNVRFGGNVRSKNPVYPTYGSRSNGSGFHRFGKLLLSGIVDKKGRFKKLKVENADFPEHGKAAQKIIKEWEFRPGMKEGKFVPTKVWIDLIIYPPLIKLINEEEELVPPIVLKAYHLAGESNFSDQEGTITLVFTINKEGIIEDLEIENCKSVVLAERLQKSFLRWEFQPGLKEGKAVRTRASYSINYKKTDKCLPKLWDVKDLTCRLA